MRILTILRRERRATLRVSSEGDPATFDALLLFGGRRRRRETRILRGEHTPFTLELPDRDVTVVVQSRDRVRALTAEYEREVGGHRVLFGRSRFFTPVLQRRGDGIVCTGFTGPDDPNGVAVDSVEPAI
jgi:hypothetical protein